jgi:hypothetical protein
MDLPSWAYEIEIGDPICSTIFSQIGGFVKKKIILGGRHNTTPAYLVEYKGQQNIILADSARLMGGPEQKYLARLYEIQNGGGGGRL